MFLHLRGETPRGRELLGNVLAQSKGDWVLSTLAQETLADAERRQGREARAQARLKSAARMCERVGVPSKQALYLGMLAESLWAVGEPAAAIAALEEGARAAKSLTLSHAFILLHIGPLDDATEWLAQFAAGEPDPQRSALAQLGLARAHAWSGKIVEARAACDAAMATLAPSPVARFVLPIRAMRSGLDGDLSSVVAMLGEIERACAPSETDEALLDAGEAMVARGAARPVIERYLELSRDVHHRGLRYRVEDLRSELFTRIGDAEGARESVLHSQQELDRLFDRLTDEYRERIADHPWFRSVRRVRAVP
jgi:hypothetical protein